MMEIFTVKDNKAGTFNTPFFQPTDVHALRAFKAEVNRVHDTNMMYLYPEDFELWHIGTFDEKSGKLESQSARGILAKGQGLKQGT